MSQNNSLLNNYKEKEYFLLKSVSQNIEIALCSKFFLLFIILLVFLPLLQPENREGILATLGLELEDSGSSLISSFIPFVTLGNTNSFACYMRSSM